MREERDGMQCIFVFGKDSSDAIKNATTSSVIDGSQAFARLNNPLPTGDHWKVIGWVLDFIKRGPSSLVRVPNLRRDFIKRGAEEIAAGRGFCLELGSMAARKFRDQSDLRMQRGKVYILVSKLPAPVEMTPEVSDAI